jgi:hypothetical protein
MLLPKKVVIYITRHKLWIGNYESRKPKVVDMYWDGVDLSPQFKKIKKIFKTSKAKIILGDEISYALVLVIDSKVTREVVRTQASQLIPDKLTNTNFDWKLIGFNKPTNESLVQVIAIPQKILLNIARSAKLSDIKVDIKLLSMVLAEATKDVDKPRLILWKGQETTAVVSDHANVYFSEGISKDTGKRVQELINFAKKRYNISISHIITSWDNIDKIVKFPRKWKKEKRNINPMLETVKQEPDKGGDEDVLEIKPPELDEPTTKQIEEDIKKVKVDEDEDLTSVSTKVEEPEQSSDSIKSASTKEVDTIKLSGMLSGNGRFVGKDKIVFSKTALTVLVIVAILMILTIAAFIHFKPFSSQTDTVDEQSPTVAVTTNQTTVTITPEATIATTPNPSPQVTKAEIVFSDFKIQVLNGTGISGEASTVSELLENTGFSITNVGDAESFDYTNTLISTKEETPKDVYDEIGSILESEYTVAESDEVLTEDLEYDVQVIVGVRK